MVLSVADVRARAALMLKCLNLVIDRLLLIHGIVDNGLCYATCATLLFIVVKSSINAALLASPHIRPSILAATLQTLKISDQVQLRILIL